MTSNRTDRAVLIATAFLWIASVAAGPVRYQPLTSDQSHLPQADEHPRYFPTDLFGSDKSIVARGYHWYLLSMGECPLGEYVGPTSPQVYRLLIESRPYNAPIVIRLSIEAAGDAKLTAKVARDGGHPQLLTLSEGRNISSADAGTFLRMLDTADFWSIPMRKPFNLRHTLMGASAWLLEADKSGSYHAVLRAAPELGPLSIPESFLVGSLARLNLKSLPVGPAARTTGN